VWAFVVIVVTPLINYVSGCVQRSDPVCIQALFTELAGLISIGDNAMCEGRCKPVVRTIT
jgi:ABC-type Co2+ transport system permease subunit